MILNRRHFTLGLATMPLLTACSANAQGARGLFWTATPPGKSSSTLFAYARTAAAVTVDIIRDGDRFAARASKLVADIGNIQMPAISIPHDTLPPVFGHVDAATADRIRAILAGSFAAMPIKDKLSGFEVVILLLGEGQTPPRPSVGGTIAEHAQAEGKPIDYLVTADDVKDAYHPPDIPTLDKQIDQNALTYLLDLRDKVGPIGKYQQGLYADRRIDALAQTVAGFKEHHIPQGELLPTAGLEQTIIDRSVQAVQATPVPLFMMLPVGTLTRDGGIMSRMKDAGIKISPLA